MRHDQKLQDNIGQDKNTRQCNTVQQARIQPRKIRQYRNDRTWPGDTRHYNIRQYKVK